MPSSNHANTTSNAKPVVVLGAGGHARVLISLLKLIDRPIAAVLDDDPAKHSATLGGITITGGFDTIQNFGPDQVELVNAIGSAHRPTTRQAIYDQHTKLGYTFASLVHPAAVVAPGVKLDAGTQIMASATIQTGVSLGPNCLINTNAVVDHDTTIGSHNHIAPGVTLCGGVTIGPGCHIGAGATVVQGVSIGASTVVGAGATVLSDIGDRQVVMGTPARAIAD